jgi:hypothetical protein
VSVIDELLKDVPLPRVFRARQRFERPVLPDPVAACRTALSASGVSARIRPGMRIAVTAGSRGIANLPAVLREVVGWLRAAGAEPFLIPAMGSHGGATAEGQEAMLAGMGIDARSVGCPVRSTMETARIGTASNGLPVHIDALAARADGIVLVNRVKPHVGFRGRFESGLYKMIAIGLGKQRGAEVCHQLGFGAMEANIVALAEAALAAAPILFGVALLENAYHETCRLEVIPAEAIGAREPELQALAKRLIPRVLVSPLDVLVIDEIGKDISGTGFDTNAVGRYHTPYASDEHAPRITRMLTLDITAASHGNANGLGILDFTTRRVLDKLDFDATYPNSLTSTVPLSVKIPMVLPDDRRAIQAAIRTCNILDFRAVRLARIRNTVALETIELSENLLDEARANPRLELVSGPDALPFDAEGDLPRAPAVW